MDLGLTGKRAVVTGSTAGIGFAVAHVLSRAGARVVVNGRTQARVASAVERIRADVGGDVTGVAADLGTAEGVASFVAQVPDADVLVNNLGIYEPKAFLEIPDSEWLRYFEVNVLSGVRLTRHYLPGMVKNDWGRVVFVSSESAQQIPVEMIHYGMTKTAQVAVARGVAESVAGTGVTVNSVLAGPTGSEGVAAFVEALGTERGLTRGQVEQQFFDTARPSSLLRRFATPEEVAVVVAFVASARATTINGAAVRADGGVIRSVL
jgi:NAD(P)-dependent dehydrogenase (short-subunit alcohol dehydrogenase family)